MEAIPDCIREKWISGLNSQLGCVGTLEYNFPHPQTHLQWHDPLWDLVAVLHKSYPLISSRMKEVGEIKSHSSPPHFVSPFL